MQRSSVLLPEPLVPSSASVSPCGDVEVGRRKGKRRAVALRDAAERDGGSVLVHRILAGGGLGGPGPAVVGFPPARRPARRRFPGGVPV